MSWQWWVILGVAAEIFIVLFAGAFMAAGMRD